MTNDRQDISAMADEELREIWLSASDEETENLSPFLEAVILEMERRKIPF